jgi:lipoprotein signal peptidase
MNCVWAWAANSRKMVLDSQSHIHRQMRILSQIEKRRRYRSWAQAFQLAMLFFFADQIVKTYCAGQVAAGEIYPLFGQSLIALTKIPDDGRIGLLSRLVPRTWESFPHYFGLSLWLALFALLLTRLRHAKFGELLAFGCVLSGGFSNLVSRRFTTQTFDALMLQLSGHYVSFNIADICVLVGSFFVLRGYLLRLHFGWLKFSRSSY